MHKLMLSVVIIGILGCTAESATLETEAIVFARQQEFLQAMVECGGSWYIRRELIPLSESEKSTSWVMYEFKYPQFKIIPLSSSDNNDPNETDLEWIGMVEMEGESGRLYSARTRTWETLKGNPAELVMLKKRAGRWYIMDSFRKVGLLPNLSCKEITRLRK